jgi:uncharacterized membrane protein YgcG
MSAPAIFINLMIGVVVFVILCKFIARRQRAVSDRTATGVAAAVIGIVIAIAVSVDGATSGSSDGSDDGGGGDGGGGD